MFDNMTEFVAATLREDAAAWARQQAPVRAMMREHRMGRQRDRKWRTAVARALVALATRLAPNVVASTSTHTDAIASEVHHGLPAGV